jgi:hypothetical protein
MIYAVSCPRSSTGLSVGLRSRRLVVRIHSGILVCSKQLTIRERVKPPSRTPKNPPTNPPTNSIFLLSNCHIRGPLTFASACREGTEAGDMSKEATLKHLEIARARRGHRRVKRSILGMSHSRTIFDTHQRRRKHIASDPARCKGIAAGSGMAAYVLALEALPAIRPRLARHKSYVLCIPKVLRHTT